MPDYGHDWPFILAAYGISALIMGGLVIRAWLQKSGRG